ncbi:nuclease-related domain-containing protein [Lachnospiraceae bacterium 47-T17]
MDRKILEYNGTLFENEITRYLYANFPNISVIQNKQLFSAYLRKDTQIDVIAVCDFGVFIIEAKNWKQWIKGEYDDTMWVGKSNSRDAMRVMNVYNQNFIHIRALRNRIRALGLEPVPFNNIICVPDGIQIFSGCKEICTLSGLRDLMKRQSTINCVKVDIECYKKKIMLA